MTGNLFIITNNDNFSSSKQNKFDLGLDLDLMKTNNLGLDLA